jgi:hypothetical protein
MHAQNPDKISETSELESSRQAPKPKRRHRQPEQQQQQQQPRIWTQTPFNDDSSVKFNNNDTQSTSDITTASSTPRQPTKFLKKPSTIPLMTEKISVARSPRDTTMMHASTRPSSSRKSLPASSTRTTGLLADSSILRRSVQRQTLYAQGHEVAPGTFNRVNDDDRSSSDTMSTSTRHSVLTKNKKRFLKKTANVPAQVPELKHLESETNSSDQDSKQRKQHKTKQLSSSTFNEIKWLL